MPIDPAREPRTHGGGGLARTLGLIAGWAWAIAAGGGGFLLLLEKGPWPLTNGWFAMLSGISACPFKGWALRRFAGIAVPGRAWLFISAFLFVAGRVALSLGI